MWVLLGIFQVESLFLHESYASEYQRKINIADFYLRLVSISTLHIDSLINCPIDLSKNGQKCDFRMLYCVFNSYLWWLKDNRVSLISPSPLWLGWPYSRTGLISRWALFSVWMWTDSIQSWLGLSEKYTLVAYEKFSKMPRHNPKADATHHKKKGSPRVSFEVFWKVPIWG